MNIIPLTEDLKDTWNAVVAESPDAWIYHLYEWQEMLHSVWHAVPHSFLIEDEGKIVGICPIQNHMGNSALINSNAFGPAGIALVSGLEFDKRNEYFKFAYNYIYQLLGKHYKKACIINIPPLTENSLKTWQTGYHPLLQFGLVDCSTKTAIIDLRSTDIDTLYKSLRRNHRRNIKKCQDLGMTIRFGSTSEDVHLYYQLHVNTYNRTGVKPHPIDYFKAIHHLFIETEQTFMIILSYKDQVISVANFAHFKNKVLYWTAANLEEAGKYGAQKYLLWQGIKHAKETLGAHYIEVGEMFDNPQGKLKGLTQLKSGWGDTHPFWKSALLHKG